jgi:hypothetical protein
MLDVRLNNISFPEPTGLDQMDERKYFSTELSGFVIEVSGSLEFFGDAYNYLRDTRDTDLCTEVIMTVYMDGVLNFSAKIFLIDAVWYLDQRKVSVEVTHNGWLSIFDHNKQIKCYTGVAKSKNGVGITTTLITNFRLPDKDNVPANDSLNRHGMYLFDMFKTIIEFMSDGVVSFRSDLLDYTVANPTQTALTAMFTGRSIRSAAFSTYPYSSFKMLFDDMNSMYNLAFDYEEDSSGKFIRIEGKEYFNQTIQGEDFIGAVGVQQELDRASFPAKVVFGSANAVQLPEDKNFLADLRFLSHSEEEYHLGGQCNIDSILDLSTRYIIIDPNVIQDILPSGAGNNEFDEDICLVVMDPAQPTRALMTENPAVAGEYYLNDFVTNEKVALRWFGQIPISIYAWLGEGNNGCFIGLSNTQTAINLPRVFYPQTETPPFHDLNNNFGTPPTIRNFPKYWVPSGVYAPGDYTPQLGGYYVAPFSAVYNYEVELFFEFEEWFRLYAVVMSPAPSSVVQSATLLAHTNVIDDPALFVPNGQQLHVVRGGTVYMQQGHYLGVAISHPNRYQQGSTFTVFDPLGDRWASFYQEDTFILKSSFEFPISDDKWQRIKDYPHRPMRYEAGDGILREGWLNEISRNLVTGKARVIINEKG